MNILLATMEDVLDLANLINGAYRGEKSRAGWTTEAHLLDGTRTNEAHIKDLINGVESIILKCVDDEGKIIGCVHLEQHGNKLYLGMLTVSPELQGAGIGKQLLYAADKYAKRQGCIAVYMTVISVRHELINWYQRQGYHKTGEVKPFPFDEKFGVPKQPLELIILEKEVD